MNITGKIVKKKLVRGRDYFSLEDVELAVFNYDSDGSERNGKVSEERNIIWNKIKTYFLTHSTNKSETVNLSKYKPMFLSDISPRA